MKYYLIFIILLFNYNNSLSQEKERKVVIIFNNFPEYKSKVHVKDLFYIVSPEPPIEIFDGIQIYYYTPNSNKNTDTLVYYSLQNNSISLSHRYHLVRSFDYLFNRGDTVTFTYDAFKKPFAHIKNKNLNDSIVNYEYYEPYKLEDSVYLKYKYPVVYIKSLNQINRKYIKNIRNEKYENARNFLVKRGNLLDSLFLTSKLSLNYYSFFKNKNEYLIYCMDYEQRTLNRTITDSILRSSIYFGNTPVKYLLEFAEQVIDSTLVRGAPILHHSNGSEIDYRVVYNSIYSCNNISRCIKVLLLYKYFERVSNLSSASQIKENYRQLHNLTNDTLILNDIRRKYIVDIPKINTIESKKLYLMNGGGEQISLEDLISKNKGKVLYIDFWASWCTPCRISMKSSNFLRSLFNKEKIAFLYISLDKNQEKWLRATAEEKLTDYKHNYRIIDGDNSKFLKNIDLRTIPRYIIVNKKGDIIYKNAPTPDSDRIKKILSDEISQ